MHSCLQRQGTLIYKSQAQLSSSVSNQKVSSQISLAPYTTLKSLGLVRLFALQLEQQSLFSDNEDLCQKLCEAGGGQKDPHSKTHVDTDSRIFVQWVNWITGT